MKIVEIIESKCWVNKITGQTASIYGAAPYTNEEDKLNWKQIIRGYTWKLDNGTIGLGRTPAKTYEEALRVMNLFNGGVS